MEIHSFNQVPQCFRFKWGQARITDFSAKKSTTSLQSAFKPKGYLHNDVLVRHLTRTLCPPSSFPTPRTKFLEDSVLLQQHGVGASWHFTWNKPLGLRLSFYSLTAHLTALPPTFLRKPGRFPFVAPVAVWHLTSTSCSLKELYHTLTPNWRRLKSINFLPFLTTLHSQEPEHHLHTNW